ncbi:MULTISPECIES: hypothetical protein [unclassified Alteromonas]|uniref:hypothetical protein n=1 Tax=unclassified Alteromonas TaxID=2614992 RepID=UPI000509C67F|nr:MULTISPECIES: hypothetical protein [unclassified Alteromonas]
MKIDSKSIPYYAAALLLIATIVAPLLGRMEPQVIFGLSNHFWSGFIGASSLGGMIIILVFSLSNQKISKS